VTQTPSHTPSAPETGLDFFRKRKININNLDQKNLTWKVNYPGSLILCTQNGGAVNAIIVGQFSTGSLHTAVSDRGYAPSYRVILNLDAETIGTLQNILKSGPFNSDNDDKQKVYSPLKDNTATFTVKFRTLKEEEKWEKEEEKKAEKEKGKDKKEKDVARDKKEKNENDEEHMDLREEDPFPFFFDGQGIGKGTQTKLEKFSASSLTRGDWLAIQTNVATFDMSNSGRGFTFSLREVYYLGTN
jgi:hypothetical protein